MPSEAGRLEAWRGRLGRLLLAAAVVGAGLFLLSRSARQCDLELSMGSGMLLTSAEASLALMPEGTLVHRASFFFPGGEQGPVVRTLHPRLQEGRRYRLDLRLRQLRGAFEEAPESSLSREFLFEGESAIRINF